MRKNNLRSVASNISIIIQNYPVLSLEEERKMIAEYHDEREKLNELLVLHNLRFAVLMSHNYREKSETEDDMLMRAIHGLIVAASKFDIDEGTPFVSYARRVIKSSYRDLFDKILSAPKTRKNTIVCIDSPVGDEDGGKERTMCDFIPNLSSPEWKPINPHTTTEDEDFEKQDVSDFVDFIIERYLIGVTEKHKKLVRDRILGSTLQELAEREGVSRQAIDEFVGGYIDIIAGCLKSEPNGSELHDIIVPYKKKCYSTAKEISDVKRFLDEHNLVIVEDEGYVDEEARVAEKMLSFDKAFNEMKSVSSRPIGSEITIEMRKVYELCIARRMSLHDAAVKMGRPETYVEFMRHKATDIVRRSKKGEYRIIAIKGKNEDNPDLNIHQIKDELYNVVGTGGHYHAVNYNRLTGTVRRKSDESMNLITTFSPYRGGFYSHIGYLTFASRTRRIKGISLRELEMHVRLGNIPMSSARKKMM